LKVNDTKFYLIALSGVKAAFTDGKKVYPYALVEAEAEEEALERAMGLKLSKIHSCTAQQILAVYEESYYYNFLAPSLFLIKVQHRFEDLDTYHQQLDLLDKIQSRFFMKVIKILQRIFYLDLQEVLREFDEVQPVLVDSKSEGMDVMYIIDQDLL